MIADLGISVTHTTVLRWMQRYLPEFEERRWRYARPVGGLTDLTRWLEFAPEPSQRRATTLEERCLLFQNGSARMKSPENWEKAEWVLFTAPRTPGWTGQLRSK